MTKMPASRRLRFGLRTMFIVLTALCCWLAWESSIVRERQLLLAEVRMNPTYQVVAVSQYTGGVPGNNREVIATIPLIRRWLGDQAIQEIWYRSDEPRFSEDHLSRIGDVFPEAKLRESLPIPLEPCHPGCFPSGTLVETPDGIKPIETILASDVVTFIGSDGATGVAIVQSVFQTQNRIWRVKTTRGILLTTETQPLCVSAENTMPAGKLQPGDVVLYWDSGEIREASVMQVTRTDAVEEVFNLVLGNCEKFVANGYLARSKPPPEFVMNASEGR